MWRVVFVLCVVCCSRAFATTLTVDGVGTSPEHFATIREALIDLGASGQGTDGASDEIRVMVNVLTEPVGLIVNGDPASVEGYPPVRDGLTLEGDGDADGAPCRLTLTSNPHLSFLKIFLGEGQDLALRNLDLLPGARSGGPVWTFVSVEDSGGASLTLDNIYVGPVVPGGAPVTYDDPSGGGVAVSCLTRGSDEPVTYRIEDCDVFDHAGSGIGISLGSGTVTVRGVRVMRCRWWDFISEIWRGSGMGLLSRLDASAEFVHLISEDNGDGLVPGEAIEAGHVFTSVIGPGCQICLNRQSGVRTTRLSANLSAVGTSEEPVRVCDNGRDGLVANGNPPTGTQLRHVILTENADAGLRVADRTVGVGRVTVANCLFARNCRAPSLFSKPQNVRCAGTLGGPASLEFDDCTIHDVLEVSSDSEPSPGARLSTDGLSVTFRDCLFSGTTDESALALTGAGSSAERVAVLDHCVVALEGPDALGFVNATGAGTVILKDCLFVDPMYVQTTDPDAPGYYDVQNPLLEHAASDGGPLSGWGDYVGPPPPELMGIVAH